MALRFFADHCISNAIARALREAGHEVLRLKDHMSAESSDSLVIAKPQDVGAILLSQNGDFSDIVAYPPAKFRGIIALQIRDHPEVVPVLIRNLVAYFGVYPASDHYSGKLLVVEPARIRVRE